MSRNTCRRSRSPSWRRPSPPQSSCSSGRGRRRSGHQRWRSDQHREQPYAPGAQPRISPWQRVPSPDFMAAAAAAFSALAEAARSAAACLSAAAVWRRHGSLGGGLLLGFRRRRQPAASSSGGGLLLAALAAGWRRPRSRGGSLALDSFSLVRIVLRSLLRIRGCLSLGGSLSSQRQRPAFSAFGGLRSLLLRRFLPHLLHIALRYSSYLSVSPAEGRLKLNPGASAVPGGASLFDLTFLVLLVLVRLARGGEAEAEAGASVRGSGARPSSHRASCTPRTCPSRPRRGG